MKKFLSTATLFLMAMSLSVQAQPIPRPFPPRPIPVPIPQPLPPANPGDVLTNPDQFSVMVPSGAREAFAPFKLEEHPVVENGQLVRKGVAPDALISVPTEVARRDRIGNVLRDSANAPVMVEKQVRAGDYYNQLNQFEQFLTGFGYTMRKDYSNTTIKKLIIKPEELQRFQAEVNRSNGAIIRDPQVLANHTNIRNTNIRVATDRSAQNEATTSATRDVLVLRPIIIDPRIPNRQPKVVNKSKAWSDHWGWDDKFSAYAEAGLTFYGDMNTTKATAKGEAGGRIFGKKLKMIYGDGYAETPSSGALLGHVHAYVLGFKIIDSNYNNSTAHFETLEQSKNFDESTTIHFALGPIPMSAKIGGQGHAGLLARVAYLPLRANSDVTPNAYAKGYIQVGVDIVVAGAGAGADLKIVEDSLQLTGRVHLVPNGGAPKFLISSTGYNALDALRGKMYAYVYIYVPRWGIPPWKKKQWDWNIFEFGGLHLEGMLFSIDESVNLY